MWYDKPLRIAALQCESKGDPRRVLDVWSRMGFNVEQLLHISADDYCGYYKEDKADEIRNYVASARAKGLRVIFYLGMLGPKEIREKCEWRYRDSAGKTMGVPCINSPYRDWYFSQVKKVAALGIDGLFLDGPYFLEDTCYCPYCADGYRARYGAELPAGGGARDKASRDFIEFRYDSVAGFLADAGKALKSVNPAAIIYMNGQPLTSGVTTGRQNRRLVPHQDMLGAEGGFIFYIAPGDVPWWKPGVTARLLESQSGGKPTVIFIAGDHKEWSRYLHTPSETRLLIADAVANGANPWYGIHSPIETIEAPGGQAAEEMMRLLKANEDYYAQTESVAEVAILWSSRTADFSGEAEKTDFNSKMRRNGGTVSYASCFGGFCEMLIRGHAPFDVIDEVTLLEQRLAKYKTIVLPNCVCLADTAIQAIKDFVRTGGNLVASFETSLYGDDYGRRANLGLSEVFGIELGAKVYDLGAYSYMSLVGKDSVFNGVYPSLLPAPAWGLECFATSATPIACFREPMQGQYQPLSQTAGPAIVMNKYGTGRSLYLAGNFGQHYRVYGIGDYLTIFRNVLNQFSPPLIGVRNLPETVEVILRRQRKAGRLLIHLVNFTGAMRRPISEVIPITGSAIELPMSTLRTLKISERVKVTALNSGKDIALVAGNETMSIIVPEFHEYEVLSVSAD